MSSYYAIAIIIVNTLSFENVYCISDRHWFYSRIRPLNSDFQEIHINRITTKEAMSLDY